MQLTPQQRQTWDEFSKRLSSYGMGLINAPIDAVKYAGLGANEVAERVGLLSKEESIRRANAINQVMTELPFLPVELRDYRAWLQKNNPEMFELGEIIGATAGAAGLAKTTAGMRTHVKPITAAGLAAIGLGKEEYLEPKIQELSTK